MIACICGGVLELTAVGAIIGLVLAISRFLCALARPKPCAHVFCKQTEKEVDAAVAKAYSKHRPPIMDRF